MKNSILVTGGAGFIGSHVVDALIKSGCSVVILDNLSGGSPSNLNSKAIFIKGSLTNQELLEKLFFKYRFNYVYHLAAYAAEGLSHFVRHFNYENNLIGSVNLINLSIKYRIKRFIFTSSIAVYGNQKPPTSESYIPHPIDPYGISKYAVELDLMAAKNLFGLEYTIFRPHNVYGERQNTHDPYRNVVGIFLRALQENRALPIFGNGEQQRAFTYIGDVAPQIAISYKLKGTANQIINIGSDEVVSVNYLASLISKIANKSLRTIQYPSRKEVILAFSAHQKYQQLFGIHSYTKLKDGLAKTYKWIKENTIKQPTQLPQIEITQKLPSLWKKLVDK